MPRGGRPSGRPGFIAAGSDTATAFIATGAPFPDALGGSAAAGRLSGALPFTAGSALPDTTASALTSDRPAKVVFLGGKSVIRAAVISAVQTLLRGATVQRWSGADRYARQPHQSQPRPTHRLPPPRTSPPVPTTLMPWPAHRGGPCRRTVAPYPKGLRAGLGHPGDNSPWCHRDCCTRRHECRQRCSSEPDALRRIGELRTQPPFDSARALFTASGGVQG